MTEKFRLAANVLLKRRLNNLVRIDNNIEIDRSYITCAEYQLFIDEMCQEGKNRQPDHWASERFPPGDAKKPVTGVRASDAEEFCQWLTQKESVSKLNYRLPSLAETKAILATTEGIGCWCKKENTWAISGITSQQWRVGQQQLSKYLIVRDKFNLNRNLYRNLDRDLNRDLDRDLNRDLNLNLYRDLNLNLYRDLNRDLNLNLYLYRDLNRDHERVLDLYRDLDRDLVLDLDCDLDYDLDRVLVLDLDLLEGALEGELNRDLYRNLYREIDNGRASNLLLIYFPLIFVILIYQFLTKIYREAVQNVKSQKTINISFQECEEISKKYAQKLDEIYPLYVYLVLIDERQKGNMPAWEGIRIVREREEID